MTNFSKSPQKLSSYVGRKVFLALAALPLIFGGVWLLSHWFREPLRVAMEWVAQTLGLPGLGGVILISDAVLSPFPPDLILLVVSQSFLKSSWVSTVFILGLISSCAGMIGWFLGTRLKGTSLGKSFLDRLNHKTWQAVEQYGVWAVVIGALTPVPFSFTCWAAGILGLKPQRVFLACLVRIPRFYFYYLIIASAS